MSKLPFTEEDMARSYQSMLSSYHEREENERNESRSLNSGFGAFDKWEKKRGWRSDLRQILDDTKTADDLKASEDRLRKFEWTSGTTCLVHAFENSYGEEVSVEKLVGRDRVITNLICDVEHYGERMFFATLLTFQRWVDGSKSNKKASSKKNKRARNDEDVFVGYDAFKEIESDTICIARWAPIDGTSLDGYRKWLKEEDEEMFVENVINEDGLRGMFVGMTPDDTDDTTHVFYRSALVICPVKHIIKLDEAGPNVQHNRSWWVLRSGCRVAPREMKEKIVYHAMRDFRERTRRCHLEGDFSLVMKFQLEQLFDILQNARAASSVLEMISTLAAAAKDLPHMERNFSEAISDFLISFHSTDPFAKDKAELCWLAKERMDYLARSTKNGKPTFTHSQKEAIFDAGAKYSAEVQEFLRGDLEEKEFGPFRAPKSYHDKEAESWANNHFGWINASYSSNSLEGKRAQNIGKYSATATVEKDGSKVRLKKDSRIVLVRKVKLYEIHVAALDKLGPVFGKLAS